MRLQTILVKGNDASTWDERQIGPIYHDLLSITREEVSTMLLCGQVQFDQESFTIINKLYDFTKDKVVLWILR